MANDSEYLKALLSRKGEISQAQTSSSSEQSSDNGSSWSWGVWDDIFGNIDELAAQFGSGYVSAFEGIADLAATGLGALGDATGWYSSKPFTDWAAQDIGAKAAKWTKAYANLTPWNIIKKTWGSSDSGPTGLLDVGPAGIYTALRNPQATGEFYSDAIKSFGDIFSTSSSDALDDDVDEYYDFDKGTWVNSNAFGQFAGGVAHSIGMMLPSIHLGKIVGGKTGSEALAKAVGVGMESLAAGGKSSEEALNDGANAGQALGYGVLSGAVEAGTEYIPWEKIPGLGKLLGENVAPGIGLRQFSAKELAKSMAQEGLEEVVSDLANPVIQMVYKGTDSLGQYTDPEYYKDIFVSFMSGAVTGGIMEGATSYSNTRKYSNAGVQVINDTSQWVRDYDSWAERNVQIEDSFINGNLTLDQYEARMESQAKALLKLNESGSDITERFDKLDSKYKEAVQDYIKDPSAIKDAMEDEGNKRLLQSKGLPLQYGRVEYDASSSNSSQAQISATQSADVANTLGSVYNQGDGNEFGRLQEESRRELNESSWQERSARNDEALRERLSSDIQRELERRGYNPSSSDVAVLRSSKGTEFTLYENVDGQTFRDVFEISRTYLANGELVDLHEVKSSEKGVGYEDTTNYLSSDGLSGFAITKDGDLISVFNVNKGKKGFLDAISGIIKEKVKTLDCYVSPNQNLQEMYEKKFGFKTASIMDHNMEYDHDDIAKNHNNPKVAFMVNTNQDVETKHFNKDQYAEAQEYQMSYVNGSESQKEANQTVKSNDSIKEETNTETSKNNKNTEIERAKTQTTAERGNAEEGSITYKKAIEYMDSPQSLQKEAAPNQTTTLKRAKETAKALKAITANAVSVNSSVKDVVLESSEKLSKKLAAAVNAGDKSSSVESMDMIFDDFMDKGYLRTANGDISLKETLTLPEYDYIKKSAHELFQNMVEEADKSKIAKARENYENRLFLLKEKLSLTVEEAKLADRINKGFELSRRYIKDISSRLLKGEIDDHGRLLDLIKMSPNFNVRIKDGRMSDNSGISLRADTYTRWMEKSYQTVQKLNDSGMFINDAGNEMLSVIDDFMLNANEGNNALTIQQMRDVLSFRKMLDKQISKAAVEERVARREKATGVNLETDFAMKANPSKDVLWSNLAYENIKANLLPSAIMGYDGSMLQEAVDKLVDAKRQRYEDEKAIKDAYMDKKVTKSISRELKKKVLFRGKKVSASGLADVWMSLNDPDTKILMDSATDADTRAFKLTKENLQFDYTENTIQEIEDAVGKENLETLQKFLRDFYDDNKGIYKERVRKLQFEKLGDSTVPDDATGYYPRSHTKESTVRTNSLQSLQSVQAGITPSNSNLSKQRSSKHSIVVLEGVDPFFRMESYKNQITSELNMRYPTAEFLSLLGINVEGPDGKATRLQITLGQKFTQYMRYIAMLANDMNLVETDGMVQALQRGLVTATLGLNVINSTKNLLSLGKEGYNSGFMNVLKTVFMPWSWDADLDRKVREAGWFQVRYSDGILSMETEAGWKGFKAKFSRAVTYFYTFFDKITTRLAVQVIGKSIRQTYPNLSHAEWVQMTVNEAFNRINISQSTSEDIAKSLSYMGIFNGRKSQVNQTTWIFQSDVMSSASMVVKDLMQLNKIRRIIKQADSVLNDPNSKTSQIEIAKKAKANAISTRATIVKHRLPAFLLSTLISAILKYLIEDLNSRVKGNKAWSDAMADEDTAREIVMNTLGSFLPYADTIFSAAKYNDGQIEIYAFSGIQDILQAMNKFSSGKTRAGLVDLMMATASIFGIPLKNLYSYVFGLTSNFDPKLAVEMKNALYQADKATTSYSSNYAMALYERVGETSDEVSLEMSSLYDAGYSNARPSGVYETYTDKNGNEITISWTDRQSMKRYYSRANSKLARMLKSNQYKQLDDSAKAYVINKLYKAYKDAALAKVVTKGTPDSIITALAYANYNDLGTILTAVAHIRTLEATSTSTKKQRAVAYVNSLGLPKSQRMLILSLAGYTVDSKYISSALRSAGISASDAKKIATA